MARVMASPCRKEHLFKALEEFVVQSLSAKCPTLCNPMDCSPPGSPVQEILWARIWSGLPFPSPGDPPHPGIEPGSPESPALQVDSLPSEPPGKSYTGHLIPAWSSA